MHIYISQLSENNKIHELYANKNPSASSFIVLYSHEFSPFSNELMWFWCTAQKFHTVIVCDTLAQLQNVLARGSDEMSCRFFLLLHF